MTTQQEAQSHRRHMNQLQVAERWILALAAIAAVYALLQGGFPEFLQALLRG